VTRASNAQKSAEYLALNPSGLIPVLARPAVQKALDVEGITAPFV
jgi:hypothetical protein